MYADNRATYNFDEHTDAIGEGMFATVYRGPHRRAGAWVSPLHPAVIALWPTRAALSRRWPLCCLFWPSCARGTAAGTTVYTTKGR